MFIVIAVGAALGLAYWKRKQLGDGAKKVSAKAKKSVDDYRKKDEAADELEDSDDAAAEDGEEAPEDSAGEDDAAGESAAS